MKKCGIFVNSEKAFSFKTTRDIIEVAKKFNVDAEVTTLENKYDIIISLGGDGTFLSANRQFLGTPILGINLGHLGFLSEASKDDLDEVVSRIAKDEYMVQERTVLEANINNKKLIALNDIVVGRTNLPRLLNLNLNFDGKYVDKYMADGLIVATPTGSTAYSLSAGGPIVEPRLDVIVATPICAHSLHQRPIIASGDTVINISSETTDFMVTADGQIFLEAGELKNVEIRKARNKASIVKINDKCFFDIVREKFHI